MQLPNYSFTFGEKEYPYSIQSAQRKTIGIVVEPTGDVVVKYPIGTDVTIIKDTVYKKRNWIVNKIKLVHSIKPPVPKAQEPVSGETILFKNQRYQLRIHEYSNKRPKLTRVCRDLHIYLNEDLSSDQRAKTIKKLLVKWYKEKAENFLQSRIHRYQKYLNVSYSGIQIRDSKLRWGSCTPSNTLIFNWRLIMAPISAIDYVVVHELSHLKYQSHSKLFWMELESILPNYRKWKNWLHINGQQLNLRW